ncbi:UDP-glucose dehydrogenase family protein [Nocardia barduliensis]|uniref:UDP-glucose dehydrogenase family protein n=1 Tax=Nocardia barduliensis TaxID=2736643 RepID=UPI00157438F4|nr:UDP-glucose/GDP-mannose dehydrogenase family protein [Nocardia barduliensis]
MLTTSRRLGVIGAGYVGLTTAVCLAHLGHTVACADIDAGKVARLSRGMVDIAEPRLADLVAEELATGRLRFTADLIDAVSDGGGVEFLFLCLPTPACPDGAADLSAIETVAEQVRNVLTAGSTVVVKSTVPAGSARRLAGILGDGVEVVSNPEFLREGSTVADFFNPHRIVIGADDAHAAGRVAALYADLDAAMVLTDAASAELAKHAANCFLAMKLSYVNTLAELCERVGADIVDVTTAMGHDPRIGPGFMSPGPGWGGPCLPKDAEALHHLVTTVGLPAPLIGATIQTNQQQAGRIVSKVRSAVTGDSHGSLRGVRLGVLGLTFKAGTDDLRCSPSVDIARLLQREGAEVVAHDPVLHPRADYPELAGIAVTDDPHRVADNASAVLLLTDWPQYRSLDWRGIAAAMRHPILIDTRNLLDRAMATAAGLRWTGTGREALTLTV